MYDIAIIGAGASGMAAAISAKKENSKLRIVLIEALPRIGKKILATGNGRCNLTNLNAVPESYNTDFVSSVLHKLPPRKVLDFFSSIGLECLADSESRVYPMSNMASSVLDCLRLEIERLKIDVMTDTRVSSVRKTNGIFIINSDIRSKRVILSTGGKASASQGSDGSGYPLLESLGHRITPLYSGLVQLTVKENLRVLKGIRVKADVSLSTAESKLLSKASGEVLFADYGLSGIAVMDVSRSVRNNRCICTLNVIPELTGDAIESFIVCAKKRNPSECLDDALAGIIPKKLGQYLIKVCGMRADITLADVRNQQINLLASKLKGLDFTVTGTRGFDSAQITVGGADTSGFDMTTLESVKVRGLYCTGELLDVDSQCGGFNLQWAWASGITAGRACAESL